VFCNTAGASMDQIHNPYMSASTPSLDQLRVFAAVADAGSFSAAARRLGRSQPVVSYVVAHLEGQLGFALFERGRKLPTLTENGQAVLAHARRLCLLSDELAAGVEALKCGMEVELTLAADPLFSPLRLAGVLSELARAHPSVNVTVRTEPLGGVLDLVLSRQCVLGISALVIDWPDEIEPLEFGVLDLVPVAAPGHPLASGDSKISAAMLHDHLQLILRDPGDLTKTLDMAVSGVRTWRLTDLSTKRALLRAGVGWGHMPLHCVADDLASGALVKLKLPIRPGGRQTHTLIHRLDAPPGPAGRWLIERLVSWDMPLPTEAADQTPG
jgi:DNA-binding transcriptional LysR family regulator